VVEDDRKGGNGPIHVEQPGSHDDPVLAALAGRRSRLHLPGVTSEQPSITTAKSGTTVRPGLSFLAPAHTPRTVTVAFGSALAKCGSSLLSMYSRMPGRY
jgi:hypothetical protein